MEISYGVPQGSIHGPLIFISCMNSLPSSVLHSTTFLYADDRALVVMGESETEITSKLTNDLNECSKWLSDHYFSLNVSKTKLMFLGTGSKLSSNDTKSITFDKGHVNTVVEYKYLGALLDGRLKFDRHANYGQSKVIPKMKTLERIRPYITRNMALYLYVSPIQPVLEYIDFVYDPMNKCDCN